MRLLIDANLSPKVATFLRQSGIETTHVIALGLMTASDSEIFDHAAEEGYVVVTTDSDFPMLLALRRAANPSVIHLRGVSEVPPEDHAALLTANLPVVSDDLDLGSVVSLSPVRMAVRRLPVR